MKKTQRLLKAILLLSLSTLNPQLSTCLAQGTAFTYQGRLNDGGAPANGSYDIAFTLFGTNVTGAAVAGPVTNMAVAVSNGLFTTTVDLGTAFTGDSRWLELAVSTNGANAFATLTPRQPLTPAPYAVFANTASNVSGTVSASQLSGNIPAANISGVMALAQLPGSLVTNGASGISLSGTFSGDGAGLIGLNPTNLSAGTAGINISGNAATAATATTATSAMTATTATTANNFSGSLAGDVTGTQGATMVSANFPRLDGTNVFTGSNQFASAVMATNVNNRIAGIFGGDGSGLTSLSASQIIGTIPLAQLPPSLLTNGASAVRISGTFNGSVSGNGTGLTNLDVARLVTTPKLIGWGYNGQGEITIPAGLNNATAIAAGAYHNLALRSDGTVAAWGGDNFAGQTDVPGGLSNVVAVAAGYAHSLAARSDGTVVAWGLNIYGQTNIPGGLNNVVAVAAGFAHSLALRNDGTVAAWGWDAGGQTDVPGGLNNVVAVAAGAYHSLAVRRDGTVVAWGAGGSAQTDVPADLTNAVAVSAGHDHSLALRNDGTVAAWGDNSAGQTDVPAGLANVVAIAAGGYHSLALRSDGTVVAWGFDFWGQTDVPAGLSNVVAIAGGNAHSLALLSSQSASVALLTGNNVFQGSVTATAFIGDGSGLIGLNASRLSGGTVDDARLSANVPLLNGANFFTGANNFSANISLGTTANSGILTIGSPAPDGAGSVAGGIAFVDTILGEPAWTQAGIWSDGSSGYNGSLVFGTDGDDTQNLNIQERMRITSAGKVGIGTANPASALEVAGTVTASSFSGEGSGLTGLNPTNLGAGTASINISGNAATATTATTATSATTATTAGTATSFSGALAGDVTGTQGATVVATVGGVTAVNVANGANLANGATSANTSNAIARRDASGNFSAGTITANLAGNATTATTAANFSGSLTGDVTGTQGATVVSANFPRLNGTNVFTGTNRFAGVVVETNVNNQLVGIFTGNGSGLTNVTASSVAAANIAGTMALAQLPSSLITNGASGVSIAGTFSGDGGGITNVDLVTINSHGTFTFNNLNPGFTLNSTNALAAFPSDMAAADINGDGYPDVILANYSAGTLTVMTNNGSGVFVLSATLSGFPSCITVTAADVNGDGKVDLISQSNGDTLKVVTNNGSGVFTTSGTYVVNNSSSFNMVATAADVNGDGYVDLISGNSSTSTMTVLTNNGSGGFVSAGNFGVGLGPNGVTAADVNGDGKVDLIFMSAGLSTTLKVFTNNSSGSLISFVLASSPTVGTGPRAVAVADVNGDGKMDLISANLSTNTLTVLTNAGAGTFATYASLTVGAGPRAVRALDVNGDGKLDLVSANSGTNTLTVLTNNGSGFGLFSALVVGNNPQTVASVDVNRDGGLDLVSANGSSLSVLLGSPPLSVTLSGNGGGLTNLNATNLTGSIPSASLTSVPAASLTGTLADARLSANVALLGGTNVFTGTNRFAGVLLATNMNNQLDGSFTGNAGGLTNLNATSVTGVLGTAQIPGLDASKITTGTFATGRIPSLDASKITTGAFPDSFLATISTVGKVADSALSANVALLNANNALTGGTNSFLGNVGIGTNAPQSRLHVAGSVKIDGLGDNNPALTIKQGTGSGGAGGIFHSDIFISDSDQAYLGLFGNLGAGIYFGGSGANPEVSMDLLTGTGIRFVTGTNTQVPLMLHDNGNIGIGTTTPGSPLDIQNTVKFQTDKTEADNYAARMFFNEDTANFTSGFSLIYNGKNSSQPTFGTNTMSGLAVNSFNILNHDNSGAGAVALSISRVGGSVGIGESPNGSYKLEVNGTAHRVDNSASWTTTSDRRLKTDIAAIPTGLELVEQLRPVNFHYRADYRAANPGLPAATQYGVIAQEYQQVFPSFVSTNTAGYLVIDPSPLTFVNTAAIQDLNRKLKAQEDKLKGQEEELTDLRAEVAKLRGERKSLAQSVSDLEAGFARLQKAMSNRAGLTEAKFTAEDADGVGK